MPYIRQITLPRSPLYRVARPPDPFVPPDWRYAQPDGTFIDLSAITGLQRELTQEAGLHLYDLRDERGHPLYAGIRYASRLDRRWECWALFAGRVHHHPIRVDSIAANDPHLYEAARILGLAVEDDRGSFIVPS